MSSPAGPSQPALELTTMEQRVLGSLLEKGQTVPATYPLTFNALRTACNQTSSRDPVVNYDANEIEACVRELRRHDLVRIIHTPGQRVLKVHQTLDERLSLADDERALLTLLLLRGPQAPGELKTRTERLHPFADREEVQACLTRLADRTVPLVHELPRQPGQHDRRWVHLLGPVSAGTQELTPVAEPVDRESPLAGGAAARDEAVLAAYEQLAADAAESGHDICADLDEFDAWLLGRVADDAGGAPIVDVGCGGGRVAAALAAAGATVTGLDVAPAMVELARARHPGLRFERADLRDLMRPPAASAWGAVVAWDCLDHFVPSELPGILGGLARVLAPGGVLAAAVPIGTQVGRTAGTSVGHVELPVVQHDRAAVLAAITGAGLQLQRWYLVGSSATSYPEAQRLLVVARRDS